MIPMAVEPEARSPAETPCFRPSQGFQQTGVAIRVTTRVLVLMLAAVIAGSARADGENDYPTEARADYVFGCMAASGQTRESLQHCSCSIDVLASILPYERYVQASTVLSMRQGVGLRAAGFRGTKVYDDMVADLRRAQAEAEVRCFR